MNEVHQKTINPEKNIEEIRGWTSKICPEDDLEVENVFKKTKNQDFERIF